MVACLWEGVHGFYSYYCTVTVTASAPVVVSYRVTTFLEFNLETWKCQGILQRSGKAWEKAQSPGKVREFV